MEKKGEHHMEPESFSNRDWQITRDKDGNVPDAQVTHALLTDVRSELRRIRGMLVFFVIVTVVGLVIGLLVALSHA